jgi:hypothetical protein
MTSKKSLIPASIRPLIFNLLVISSWSVKGLHLGSHLQSLGPCDWAILLPLLLFEDIFLVILGRVLLARCARRWKIFDAGVVGFVLAQVHLPFLYLEWLLMAWQGYYRSCSRHGDFFLLGDEC